jgi:hypothetical protein
MVIFSLLQGLKNLARRSQGGAGIIPVASKFQRTVTRLVVFAKDFRNNRL